MHSADPGLHGDADCSAVLELTGQPTADLLPDADLRVYPGAPHGLYATHAAEVNAELLAFLDGNNSSRKT